MPVKPEDISSRDFNRYCLQPGKWICVLSSAFRWELQMTKKQAKLFRAFSVNRCVRKSMLLVFYAGRKHLAKTKLELIQKLLGEQITTFYCLDCLADYLGVSVEEILDKIEEFKEQGCKLFE